LRIRWDQAEKSHREENGKPLEHDALLSRLRIYEKMRLCPEKSAMRNALRIREPLSEQARLILEQSKGEGLRSIRDVAMLCIRLGCGLRRAELSALRREDVQIRQGHWAMVDLVGKGNHVRTVPMPIWVKETVDSG
jgi:site-specific recombinase XerC